MKEFVYMYLPRDLMKEIPGIFLDRLRSTAAVLSVDLDGYDAQAVVHHPTDDPRAALDKMIALSKEIIARLKEDKESLEDDLRAAENLRRNESFIEETEPAPSEEQAE
jgi:hypothetical protein